MLLVNRLCQRAWSVLEIRLAKVKVARWMFAVIHNLLPNILVQTTHGAKFTVCSAADRLTIVSTMMYA